MLKNSSMSPTETNSCAKSIRTLRSEMIDNGWVKDWTLTESIRFTSPSTAASALIGGSQNGLIMWLNDDGVQLKDLQ